MRGLHKKAGEEKQREEKIRSPQPDPFSSNQQASAITLVGYLTTLLGIIGRIYLNQLVSWPSFQAK